jgi:hypothetical protein
MGILLSVGKKSVKKQAYYQSYISLCYKKMETFSLILRKIKKSMKKYKKDLKKRGCRSHFSLTLKNNCRFATRYEKKASFFRALTLLACSLIWLL